MSKAIRRLLRRVEGRPTRIAILVVAVVGCFVLPGSALAAKFTTTIHLVNRSGHALALNYGLRGEEPIVPLTNGATWLVKPPEMIMSGAEITVAAESSAPGYHASVRYMNADELSFRDGKGVVEIGAGWFSGFCGTPAPGKDNTGRNTGPLPPGGPMGYSVVNDSDSWLTAEIKENLQTRSSYDITATIKERSTTIKR